MSAAAAPELNGKFESYLSLKFRTVPAHAGTLQPPAIRVSISATASSNFEGFGTGGFNRGQTGSQHGVEDVDHLPIAVVSAGKPAPDQLKCGRQQPALEGSAIAQSAGFASQHRHIVPGIGGRLAASEGS